MFKKNNESHYLLIPGLLVTILFISSFLISLHLYLIY